MTVPAETTGSDAVIRSEVDEARTLVRKYRTGAGLVLLNVLAAFALLVFGLPGVVAGSPDWSVIVIATGWGGLNGWALQRRLSRVGELEAVVEERRAALSTSGPTVIHRDGGAGRRSFSERSGGAHVES